jgi:phage tail-like protein
MTCVAGNPNFRLLDNNVGWDQDASATVNLTGFDQPTGVCLAQLDPGALDPNQIFPYLLPPRLARGCGACEWYLVTPAPPESLLLHRDACQPHWQTLWQHHCAPAPFTDAVAVAAWRKCVAAADKGANLVRIWSHKGARRVAEISVAAPGPIAFLPHGDLLVTSANSTDIACYTRSGELCGKLKAPLPQSTGLYSIGVDSAGNVWAVFTQADSFTLWLAAKGATSFVQQLTTDALQAAFPGSGLALASKAGFCFDQDAKHGLIATTCFSWYGRPVKSCDVVPLLPPKRQTQGQMITLKLDSGVPRCEWHRVRLDADIPAGTTLCASVATTESLNPPALGNSALEHNWTTFPAGAPHFLDWTSGPAGSVDFLIVQPPGRYLFFRLRLQGDGINTPVVRRVRLDFPRITSMDRLPDVYRETPKAEDFTKRFLSLFDASIADLDAMIERYPALLDPAGVPDEILPWLGGFFDIGFDPTWDADTRRKILQAAPALYRQRGTSGALKSAVKTIFGVDLTVTELPSAGPWGSIASQKTLNDERRNPATSQLPLQRNVRLGATRLFGKNASRFRLDRSALGSAPIRSFGDPDQDPFGAGSYRLQILVPPLSDPSKEQKERLSNLINAQIPAHAVASIRVGGTGFLLGTFSAVGVDTGFVPLARPVLGQAGNVRLNRASVLWSCPSGYQGAGLGRNSIVGKQTIAG